MSDNSIIKAEYQGVEFSLGNFSNKSIISFFEKTSSLIRIGAKNLWDPIKAELEIRQLKKILKEFNIDFSQIDWSKVNELTVLEILQAVSKNQYLNINKQDNVYEAWKNLFDKLKSKESSLELDSILRYTKTLEKLNNDDLIALKEIYLENRLSLDFFKNGTLDRIAQLDLVCYVQQSTPIVVGKQFASTLSQFSLQIGISINPLIIFPNNQTLDFVNFLFKK